jgi:hypothetical protein
MHARHHRTASLAAPVGKVLLMMFAFTFNLAESVGDEQVVPITAA